MTYNDRLQELCRDYLARLRGVASRYGLGSFVDDTIALNKQKKCEATEDEVELLSRAVDDERLSRREIPQVVGKSYRQCVETGVFEKIKTLKRVGIYSRVSAILSKKD
jgi:pseudouridine-5'-phosphate glycosidase